ncbi:MAG: CvpA family protein [Candidatus Omnitrophota bacterium]
MLLNILKQVNWVDIFILAVIIRTSAIAAKSGFPVELFKFLGTLAAVYFSLHYYTLLAGYAAEWLPLLSRKMPFAFLEFIVCVILAGAGYAVFILLRSIFYSFLKMEAVSTLNKWGGLALGIARGICLSSLLVFMMFISSISYLATSARTSYSGKRVFAVAPDTYSWLWENVGSRFCLNEKFNAGVTAAKEGFLQE